MVRIPERIEECQRIKLLAVGRYPWVAVHRKGNEDIAGGRHRLPGLVMTRGI